MKYNVGDKFEVKWFLGIHLKTLKIVATTSHGKYVVQSLDSLIDGEEVVNDEYLNKLTRVWD